MNRAVLRYHVSYINDIPYLLCLKKKKTKIRLKQPVYFFKIFSWKFFNMHNYHGYLSKDQGHGINAKFFNMYREFDRILTLEYIYFFIIK